MNLISKIFGKTDTAPLREAPARDSEERWPSRIEDRLDKQYVIIGKIDGRVVFLTGYNSSRSEWTTEMSDATIYRNCNPDENSEPYCNESIAMWSAGRPAEMIEVKSHAEVVNVDRYNKWIEWEVPSPAYHDSDSGCQRYVSGGPG